MKKFLVALVLSCVMFTVACSTAWVTTLDSILAAAAPALVNILQIVSMASGKTMNSDLATKIDTDAGIIKELATDYATASSAAAPGACHQLEAAIGVYQADQTLVLQGAQVSNAATQTKIILLADLVTGTVSAITAVIPACETAKAGTFRSSPPANFSTFAARYNAILVQPTGMLEVDTLTPTLVLRQPHQHSRFIRIVSFGRLQ
jgi:hypothetical protein